jgi:hypothetical protein
MLNNNKLRNDNDHFILQIVEICNLLKRNGAARQREEWHLDIFRAKAVKVYGVPQEK